MTPNIHAIDLFAGAGGITDGFFQAGINVQHAYEKDDITRLSYDVWNHNRDVTSHPDATEINTNQYKTNIDVVAAGPPCQDFSNNQGETVDNSSLNELPFSVVEWTDELSPKVVLLENVTGLKDGHENVLNRLVDAITDLGYQTKTITLNAKKYGVAQSRRRVFVFGVRDDISPPDQWRPPATNHGDQATLSNISADASPTDYITTHDILADLPEPISITKPISKDPVHVPISYAGTTKKSRWTDVRVDPHSVGKRIKQNGTVVFMPTNHIKSDHAIETKKKMASRKLGRNKAPTTTRRLHPDKPSQVICVSSATPPIHYQGKSPSTPNKPVENVRRITPYEAALIQGFNPERTFAGTKTEQFKQIGNAVPPPLAKAIGRHIRKNILNIAEPPQTIDSHLANPTANMRKQEENRLLL